ncbi:MAG: 30S ribosomal protein S9 [Verrucomicrobiales bacterium]
MPIVSVATGRRKTATARVNLLEGSGRITINGRALEDYFPTISQQNSVTFPLQVASATQKYDITARIAGGGTIGQVGAIRHAIARALLASDSQMRKPLRDAGLLTRDPRMKERKKPGRPGARKRFQFSKR